MRYQERIYIQNDNGAVRNGDILNVNMSSDICIFDVPTFSISGASKINCIEFATKKYVITTATTIPFTFQFTNNLNTFTATNATFKYEIYKFNNNTSGFTAPAIYSSDIIPYSSISGTSSFTENVPISGISLDGEYILKGYYNYEACTDFLNRLGKTIDTRTYMSGTKYGLYDDNLDYYFLAIQAAEIPIFAKNNNNVPSSNQLTQQVILPNSGETNITITNNVAGFFIVTLNGLVLAPNLDYIYSGNIITLSSATVSNDIITIIYTTTGGNNLVGDNINILTPIVSGVTDSQGVNTAFFNTTTGEFEIYTSVTPEDSQSIIVMINGITLANGIDFYQSISNPKRIILEGNLLVGDIITIAYFAKTNVVNGLITNNPTVVWQIVDAPQQNTGYFSLEVSTGSTFSSFYSTGYTPYIIGTNVYSDKFIASGEVGDKLYYRVRNHKTYQSICGDNVVSQVYSEVIPLVVLTNSINSY